MQSMAGVCTNEKRYPFSYYDKKNEFPGINSERLKTMPQTLQLAAIMFTDIVGHTALMGNDEQKAFEQIKRIER